MRQPLRLSLLALAVGVVLGAPAGAVAQEASTGTITGRVTGESGAPLAEAQIFIPQTGQGTRTRTDGQYTLSGVASGTHTVHARLVGYRAQTASVTVAAGQRVTQDFSLPRDPLGLGAVVVTGTVAPVTNLESSVALTTLPSAVIEQAAPRSTTEMLRYVPGFTRVESSGGEVNQNIAMRGILGVEFVMFMEDGMPVFPTMHSFFMNADNLFRYDESIDRMEVVRGGASALFGSNTPGAIINFINKTGGEEFEGSMRASAGTRGLARYDLDVSGPLGESWRFNVGGFYRYDRGVRDPGFPGTRGGQVKANLTRLLENGYIRFSAKVIDDRNQFILPLPFTNPEDHDYAPGFSDYGAMNTNEGIGVRVPIPTGELELPLSDGLRTSASWFTADVAFELPNGWRLQNTAQTMRNDQGWNAILPNNAMSAAEFVTLPTSEGGLNFPAGSNFQYTFTNHLDPAGDPLLFNTANGLVSPGGEWHIEKPMAAFQDQLQIQRVFGQNTISAGAYFGYYTQENRWFFTDILMDVRDNPRFLDLVVTPPGGTPVNVTRNGFRRFLSNYVNGTGQATIVSGVLGGSFQLQERLRADLGVRVEYNDFVQSSENTSPMDLDGDSTTTFDIEPWGNGSFRHFTRNLTDWAASVGLNFTLNENTAIYASASRGYKMPALDEYLNAVAEEQVRLFDARHVQSVEAGVKYAAGRYGVTVNGFLTELKNIIGQGAVVDTVTGATTWVIQFNPESRSFGAEVEASALWGGLQLLGNATVLEAELASGTDIGARVNGVPRTIGNLSATYGIGPARLLGDWHYVAERGVDFGEGIVLPAYSYFNFGVSYALPNQGASLDVNLVNAFQSKGLEEGNPRLLTAAAGGVFLARPLLPRRVQASLRYTF